MTGGQATDAAIAEPESATDIKAAETSAKTTNVTLPTVTDESAIPAPPAAESVPPPPPAEATPQAPEDVAAQAQVKKAPVFYHFNPGETVNVRWEDHRFYAATVISKTGSSANPIYYVKFKDYNDYTQVSGKDIRPQQMKKRKAEEALDQTPAQPAPTHHSSSAVITAGPTYYKQDDSTAKKQKTDEKPKGTASKIYKNMDAKGLEKQRSSWEDWQTNSKWAKKNKKESMFRVGDSHKARVGFVGSGREMTKDKARTHGFRKEDVEHMKKAYQEQHPEGF